MRSLWPPLEAIKASLAGVTPDEQKERPAALAPVPNGDTSMQQDSAAMPAFMKSLIARRVAAQSATFSTALMAGQIRTCEEVRDSTGSIVKHLHKPVAFLLDQQIAKNQWSGWLVASETDYASYWDMLLDDRDQPFDPLAGMVQIWNPIRCVVASDSRVLGQLSSERLGAARQLALDFMAGQMIGDTPRPGHVAMRGTSDGVTVLTGTPLGSNRDPRRDYQRLYQTFAQEMSGTVVSSNVSVLPPKKKSAWFNPAFAIAATIVLAQAVVISHLVKDRGMPGGQSPADLTREMPTSREKLLVEVFFKPSATESDIRKLLQRIKGSIVNGPGEYGEYRVAIPKDDAKEAMRTIASSGVVDSASLLDKEQAPSRSVNDNK